MSCIRSRLGVCRAEGATRFSAADRQDKAFTRSDETARKLIRNKRRLARRQASGERDADILKGRTRRRRRTGFSRDE